MTFGLQSLNKSQEEISKKEHQVGRKYDSIRQRKASGVERPRINSTTEEEIAEIVKHQDIKNLINTGGEDINQLDMNKLSLTTKKDKKPRHGKATGVVRLHINSQLEKTGDEELNIKANEPDANNFRKADNLNNLMDENITKISTKGETEEGGVRVPKDDKDIVGGDGEDGGV